MSLQPYELDIIKQQLGYPLTRIGAEPYITYTALFDLVIQPYLYDNSTTSSTSVPSAGTQAITLAANPVAPNNAQMLVFYVGTSIVVDVGAAQEVTTISALSALSATITFANTHTAPYPIWPNGAEWAVRGILTRIAAVESQMYTLAPITAGIQQADEFIKLYPQVKGQQRGATLDKFGSLLAQRSQARDDLAGAVGVPNLWKLRSGAAQSSSMSPY